MSLIGVLNTVQEIDSKIRKSLGDAETGHHLIRYFDTASALFDFMSFDLPEIIILNLSDPAVYTEELVQRFAGASWLHTFGIIGIWDRSRDNENALIATLNKINILSLLEQGRIESHLHKIIHIIEENWQIIFQHDITETLVGKNIGTFIIDNDPFSVPVFAGLAATTLLQKGYISPDKKNELQLSLSELILNGIEHGNCGITMKEKSDLLKSGKSILDLVQEKCRNHAVAAKRVRFEWESGDSETVFIIRDQGDGFDVGALQDTLKNRSPDEVNGKGIIMARRIARKLSYNRRGNVVKLVFSHAEDNETSAPSGFSDQESLSVSPGDIIFEEGENSDFLYYIAAGHFGVFHAGKKVGKLGPADIFMGEMSFLLNNQRSAMVKAESRGKLIKMSRKDFVSVVKAHPHYGIFLSKLIARKLIRANEQSVALARKNI